MQVNTKFLVCSLIYMGSLSANAVGSSSLANETVHVSILSVDQTKNERNITGRIIDGDTGEALIGVSILVKGASMGSFHCLWLQEMSWRYRISAIKASR